MASTENKNPPPGFKNGDNYKKWKTKLSFWQRHTTLEKANQGSALVLSLDEESQDAVLDLDEEVIDREDGVDAIIKVLDGLYLEDKAQTAFGGETLTPTPMHLPPPPPPPPPPPQPPPSPPSTSYPSLPNLSPNLSIPKKLTLQEEIDKVKLKRVARSPGGTPIKEKSESTNPTDNAAFMAKALEKRLALMNVESPEIRCSKGDFSDDDWSLKEDLNDEKHDSAKEDGSDDNHNSVKVEQSPPPPTRLPPQPLLPQPPPHPPPTNYPSLLNPSHTLSFPTKLTSQEKIDENLKRVAREVDDDDSSKLCSRDDKYNSAEEIISDDEFYPAMEDFSNYEHGSTKEESSDNNPDPAKEDISDNKPDPAKEDNSDNKPDPAKEDSSDNKPDPAKGDNSGNKHDSAKEDNSDHKPDPAKEDNSDYKPDPAKEDNSNNKYDPAKENFGDEKHDSIEDILSSLHLEEVLSYNFGVKDITIMKSSLKVEEPQNLSLREKLLYIISKNISLDYSSRNIQLNKTSKNETEIVENNDIQLMLKKLRGGSKQKNDNFLHPLDIIVIIINCCDGILRRIILQKMVVCQLAFPLVVPNFHSNEPLFLLDVMRLMNLNAKTHSKEAHEVNQIDIPSPIVSAIRIGKISKSKSIILNGIICNHPHGIFFHRDCEAGKLTRKLTNGVIEMAWYLPGGVKQDKIDNFDDVMAFANVRGDAKCQSKQVELLSKLSSVMLVFVSLKSIYEHQCSTTLKKLSSSKLQLIFISLDEISEQSILDLMKLMGKKTFNLVDGQDMNAASLTNELRKKIKDSLKTHHVTESINEFINWEVISKHARDVGIRSDEDNECSRFGKNKANSIIKKLYLENDTDIKKYAVPLQGASWSEWSSLTKKQARANCVEDTEEYLSDITIKLNACRQEQCNLIDEMNPAMVDFVQTLINTEVDPNSRLSFVQWMKFELDIISHKKLPKIQKEYGNLLDEIQYKKYKKDINKIKKTEEDLLEVEKNLVSSSLGLEHFMRELGQVYEAHTACESYSSNKFENLDLLPQIAADLLISGFPLEIMDGDVAQIPITWVNAVFDSLNKRLGDKRVYVISILGVQSSGKSTLFNAMFGLNFAVSAGRCTKGVFAQLISVDNDISNDLGYDYILVLDTEGLRAPEHGKDKLNHDNELATLVIGLGDVTIVNIKGENRAEIEDILQICVHAFLRMQLTNERLNLKPGCYFVHQNVSAVDAGKKMSYGNQKTMEQLDILAKAAARQEGANEIETFNDVIDFDVKNNIHYFSNLWEGDPPMAPVNPSYSKKVLELKAQLLKYPSQKELVCSTFSNLQLRISDLWKALLYENFVFSFKNSIEVQSYNHLEREYSSMDWDFRKQVKKWIQGSISQILGCNKEDVGNLHVLFTNSLDECIATNFFFYKEQLEKLFTTSKDKHILANWKFETELRLKKLRDELKQDAIKTYSSHLQLRRAKVDIEDKMNTYEEQLCEHVKEFVSKNVNDESLKEMTEEKLKSMFAIKWNEWMKMFDFKQIEDKDIIRDVYNVLTKTFIANGPVLKGVVHNYNSLKFGNPDLNIIPDTDFKLSYWQKGLNKIRWNSDNPIAEISEFSHKMLSEKKKDIIENENQDVDINLIHEICNHINQNINRFSLDKPYQLRINYTVKVTVYILKTVIPLLKKRHTQFKNNNDPRHFLEDNYRDQLENFFLGAASQCMQEKTAANILSSHVKKAIVAKVKRELPQKIAESAKGEFQTKVILYSKVLEDLGDSKSFSGYIDFINNPSVVMDSWLKDYVYQYCTEIKIDANSNLVNDSLGILSNAINPLTKSAKEVNSSIGTNAISFQDWLRKFHNIVTRDIPLPSTIFDKVGLKEVKNINYFEKQIIEGFEIVKTDLEKLFSTWNMSHLKQLDEEPHALIATSILGCTEQCPFCKAICTKTMANHDGPHINPHHLPQGIYGRHWEKSKELILESCNVKVAGNSWMFYCSENTCKLWKYDGTRHKHPYKDYSSSGSEYSSWSITPSTSLDGTEYWKWVYKHFGEQLATYFEKKCPKFPKTWESITWEKAKQSIRQST